jgi:hypothetical protein
LENEKNLPRDTRGGDKNKPCMMDSKGFPQVLSQEEIK